MLFRSDYKYIAFNSEETLSKIKEKDEQSTIEAKKNALKKSFNLNNDNDL